MALTKKQEIFVSELLKDKSQREAYTTAFNCGKMSPKTIDNKAYELFKNPEVKARFTELNQKVVEKINQDGIITKERILKELAAIAFHNAAEYSRIEWKEEKVKKNGRNQIIKYQTVVLTEIEKLNENQQRAIAGIKSTTNGIEVKLYDKISALKTLGDYLNMWGSDTQDNEEAIKKLDDIAAGLDKMAESMEVPENDV